MTWPPSKPSSPKKKKNNHDRYALFTGCGSHRGNGFALPLASYPARPRALGGLTLFEVFFGKPYRLAFATLLVQVAISSLTFYFVYENAAPVTVLAWEATPLVESAAIETEAVEFVATNWHIPPAIYLALAGVWLLGLVFGGLRLLIGHSYTNFFYRRNLASIPAEWQAMVNGLALRLNFGQRVPQLALSARVKSPALIGLLKPLILLPVAMVNQLTTAQVEAVLAHELSHLAHRDHWTNFVQSVIEVLFYFNPAVHWISHQVRDEREYRVDAHVARLGIEPLLYAKTLFLLEEQRQLAPSIALAARPGSLLGRVQTLLQNTPNHYRMKPGLLLLLLLLVTTLFSFSNADEPLTTPEDALAFNEALDLNAVESSLYGHDKEVVRLQRSSVFEKSIATTDANFASMKFPPSELLLPGKMETEVAMLIDTTPPRVTSRQEIMTNDNGREIIIKKINEEVTYLEVDGKVIPKENYADYQDLIDEHTPRVPTRSPRTLAPRAPRAPRAPMAPRSPRAPRAPQAPRAPNGDGETRTYRWEQRSETDGEETENNSLFFQFFGEDGDVRMAFPGMDSMMIVNPNLDNLDFPDFGNLMRGNGMTEEETAKLQEQLQNMTQEMFEFRSMDDESIFNFDSIGSGLRMIFPGNSTGMEMEFENDDVFQFRLDRNDREIDIERGHAFDLESDLESLRDRSSSGLFGAGEGSVHRISSDRFISMVKTFQRRGLLKEEPIDKFYISEKRMKINGKKVDQSVMDRFKKEYAAKYRLDWDNDLGDFEINID